MVDAMISSCRLLFAYGTLLSGATGALGRAQRGRLQAQGRLVGKGSTEGRLFSLGRYPGLVLPGEGGKVTGEVYELADAQHTFGWLDAYEGIVPGEHPHNDYERSERPVTLVSGESIVAWVYVYRQPVAPEALIASGDWLARTSVDSPAAR